MADRHRADHAGAVFGNRPRRWSSPISTSSGPSIRSASSKAYPGSPLIARALLRPQDRLTACEVEPKARKRLIEALRRDTQARVVDLDGWMALPAFVPPNERRGLVLIDPPFEQKDEFERLADGLCGGLREMADRQLSAVVSGEKPARHRQPGAACRRGRRRRPSRRENACGWNSASRRRPPAARLASAGLLIVNPPWTLQGELKAILPELEKPLGQGGAGRFRLETPKP